MQGHYDEARSYYEGALARYEQLLGPDHPKLANELNNLGLMEGDQGKLDDAARVGLRASAQIREARSARTIPVIVRAWQDNLAFVYVAQDRNAEAYALAVRALPITEKAYGPESSDMAFALTAFVGSLNGLHRSLEAIAPAEKELAIRLYRPAEQPKATRCDLGQARW